MEVGINAGFCEPIAHDFDYIHSIGFKFVRQDLRVRFEPETLQRQGTDDEGLLQRLVTEFGGARLTPLFLLEGGKMCRPDKSRRTEPDEIATLAQRVIALANDAGINHYMLEVGNEPDIAHDGYKLRPADFAEAVRQTRDAARAAGFAGTIISGGVRNLNKDGLDYLAATVRAGLPADISIGFHRYPHYRNASVPHDGFNSRDAEWQRLLQLAGAHPVALTEFGHHTAPRKINKLGQKTRINDAQAATDLIFDLDFFRRKGCPIAAVFQLNDGADPDDSESRYGIRRLDAAGGPGDDKPCVGRIREWIGANA
jgi:hypothetical protein